MFNGELFDFQKKYKKELMDYLDSNNKEVVLESPNWIRKNCFDVQCY